MHRVLTVKLIFVFCKFMNRVSGKQFLLIRYFAFVDDRKILPAKCVISVLYKHVNIFVKRKIECKHVARQFIDS